MRGGGCRAIIDANQTNPPSLSPADHYPVCRSGMMTSRHSPGGIGRACHVFSPMSTLPQRTNVSHAYRRGGVVRLPSLPCAAMQSRIVPAVVTPFDSNNRIDGAALTTYFKFLWEAGIEDIVVNGSTGEFPSMTLEEREEVAELARAAWPGRQLVNISACSVQDCLRLLQHCQQTHKHLREDRCIADGVLLLPPYYFAASTPAGLETFFEGVIKEAQLPVYLYNFPANVGTAIATDLYTRLAAKFPQVKGIKNTFDDLPLQKGFKAAAPDRQIYVGHDPSTLAAFENGLDGAIAASASVLPELLLKVALLHGHGNAHSAAHLMQKANTWNSAVEDLGVNIFAAVKAGLSHRLDGFPRAVRPPLEAATAEQVEALGKVLHKIQAQD